jgi:hypothetical protein
MTENQYDRIERRLKEIVEHTHATANNTFWILIWIMGIFIILYQKGCTSQ